METMGQMSALLLLLVASASAFPAVEKCVAVDEEDSYGRYDYRKQCCEHEWLPNECQCFSVGGESGYNNSHGVLPACPSELQVKFDLFKKDSKNGEIVQDQGMTDFDSNLPLIIVIEGFTDVNNNDERDDWPSHILQTVKANVVVVTSSASRQEVHVEGAYRNAVANTRTVGAMVAEFTRRLKVNGQLRSYDDVHLIGHNLGAHTASMAAKTVSSLTGHKIGRISGLDPAGPLFDGYPDHVQLNKNDATFVDVIHTSEFGTQLDIGHVDFWPNKGRLQPVCGNNEETIYSYVTEKWTRVCDMRAAVIYYMQSFSEVSCAYKQNGECRMGYFASQAKCPRGVYDQISTLHDNDEPSCVTTHIAAGNTDSVPPAW